MNDTLLEWIRMALRWAHVIIAIGWIGHQMMLYALEKHFRPPRDGGGELGFDKELWMAHGGRFMRLQSTRNQTSPPTWSSMSCRLAILNSCLQVQFG